MQRYEKLEKVKYGISPIWREFAMKELQVQENTQMADSHIQTMTSLDHRYVIKYHDHFTVGTYRYLVMDYYNDTLAGHINRAAAEHRAAGAVLGFPEEQILDFCVQLFLVLEYLHSKNIVHLNIHPQNIFLAGDGTLILGDAGMSEIITGTATVRAYAITGITCKSQEHFYNQGSTIKSDVWSVGMVLHELCHLNTPFTDMGKSWQDQFKELEKTQLPHGYSPELRKLINKLLQEHPEQRPTPTEVLNEAILTTRVQQFR